MKDVLIISITRLFKVLLSFASIILPSRDLIRRSEVERPKWIIENKARPPLVHRNAADATLTSMPSGLGGYRRRRHI